MLGTAMHKAEFELLPASERRGEHALELALLDKTEAAFAGIDDTIAEYKKKIKKREAHGRPLKWTYEELAEELAIEITAYQLKTGNVKSVQRRSAKIVLPVDDILLQNLL